MLALQGIYNNGVLKLENPINVNKPLKVIVTFIDEDFNINYQSNNVNKKTNDINLHLSKLKTKYKDLPISWGVGEPDINDFTGMWKDKEISHEQLREKAWNKQQHH